MAPGEATFATTAASSGRPAAPTGFASLRARLSNVLVLCVLATTAIITFVLVKLDGWEYYATPTGVRGYTAAHRLLRPSGRVGLLFGVAGFLMMLAPIAYAARKKVKRLRNLGSMKTWLQVHIFCGVVGPVFITFHTSFKFNGIISAAYWSMVAVVLSGFVGRYLWAHIPHSLRGLEMSRADIDRRAAELGRELAEAGVSEPLVRAIEEFEHRATANLGRVSYVSLFFDDLRLRRDVARFRAAVAAIDGAPDVHDTVVAIATERATLLRCTTSLEKTKKLFDLWHVFHMPLVYIMFGIVLAHIAVVTYMGYVPFMD